MTHKNKELEKFLKRIYQKALTTNWPREKFVQMVLEEYPELRRVTIYNWFCEFKRFSR